MSTLITGISELWTGQDDPIRDAALVIDGNTVPLDVGATIQNNRTMVPLRFIVEKMGMEVYYEDADRSISIFQKIN